jgi:hypothetical protein
VPSVIKPEERIDYSGSGLALPSTSCALQVIAHLTLLAHDGCGELTHRL